MNTPSKGKKEEDDFTHHFNTSRHHHHNTMVLNTEQKEEFMNPLNRSMDDVDLDDQEEDQIDSR